MTTEPTAPLPVVSAARAAARFSKAMEVSLAEVGLSLPQYRLLVFLSGGPEKATALAGRLEVSPPSLTALVDGAVARGLVERRTSEEDRRHVRHVITSAGEKILAAGDAAVGDRLSTALGHLTPAQSRQALTGLELLGRGMLAVREARQPRVAPSAKPVAGVPA